MRFKTAIIIAAAVFYTAFAACNDDTPDNNNGNGKEDEVIVVESSMAEQNLRRAMQIVDSAVIGYFTTNSYGDMAMARYYNPYTKLRSDEKGSIWMYTSSMEAVNAIMHGLKALKESGSSSLYDAHFERYKVLLQSLYSNADFYAGTYALTSYTQRKSWTVYGVNRANSKGAANVACIENVYDDQEWFIRELLESYLLTDNAEYLAKAEYLTDYVLDGWYRTTADNGGTKGGIPWGPGYTSKHTCSNGPIISPLVWLYEIYKDKADQITYSLVDSDGRTRVSRTEAKKDFYLNAAKDLYQWTKSNLLRSDGLHYDATWTDDGCGNDCDCNIPYETVSGVRYRRTSVCRRPGGDPLSYNEGTPLSGAVDLYRVTNEASYLSDAKTLADKSFAYFAKLGSTKPDYYTYDISGFNNWFNGVLMRAYVELYPNYNAAETYVNSFQKNLDLGYSNFLYRGLLPTSLLVGWSRDNNNNRVEGMFTFAFAAEYAILAKHELHK
jgi:predicted alpha-1,6-mannanase (GH76 family)